MMTFLLLLSSIALVAWTALVGVMVCEGVKSWIVRRWVKRQETHR